VIQGAEHPEELTLLRQTVTVCEQQPLLVGQALLKSGAKKVGILGLSYTQNVKVWAQSPTLRISQFLLESGVEVKVNDPHYTREEVTRIVGLDNFEFPDGLEQFDAVLVVAGHREYRLADHTHLFQHLPNCKIILDSPGMWKDVDFSGTDIEYHVAGDAWWLNGRAPAGIGGSDANQIMAAR
jgi:UDP-N-acetyl-D-mannosaminuronate dehydrogenase